MNRIFDEFSQLKQNEEIRNMELVNRKAIISIVTKLNVGKRSWGKGHGQYKTGYD